MARSVLPSTFAVIWALLATPTAGQAELIKMVEGRRFFTIDRNTPIKDLLPIPPKTPPFRAGLPADLTQVPQVFFQDPLSLGQLPKNAGLEKLKIAFDISKKSLDRLRKKFGDKLSDKEILVKLEEERAEREKAEERIAYQLARVNFLNRKKTDHFIEVLRDNRPDLAGLPFIMGDRCRLSKIEHLQFSAAVLLVQASLGPDQEDPRNFWDFHARAAKQQREHARPKDAARKQKVAGTFDSPQDRFCVTALMQMLPVESAELQLSLVHRLSEFEATDADRNAVTAALVKLAVFSQEAAIRRAALTRLKTRDIQPMSDMLVQGLRYPWPSISQNAAEAVIELKRADLLPHLINMLEEPDPRAPAMQDVKGAKVAVVRELVRINHMRNCMLCHPPALPPDEQKLGESKASLIESKGNRRNSVDVLDVQELFAAVPPPGHELPDLSEGGGYGRSQREMQIRADITYLRQDFSLVQQVADADPWPERQRFDFLVRSRVLTEEEANAMQAELARAQPAAPYRQIALGDLRRLTGRDAGKTARAWREVLGVK